MGTASNQYLGEAKVIEISSLSIGFRKHKPPRSTEVQTQNQENSLFAYPIRDFLNQKRILPTTGMPGFTAKHLAFKSV